MSGRRSHPRFAVASPWEGAIRVLRDVVVDRTDRDELLAISHLPGVVGEEMSLDLLGAGESLGLKVKVLESWPLIVDGSLRHRLRLALIGCAADDGLFPEASIRALPDRASAEAS